MKKLLFILLLLPAFSNAQVNLDSLWGVWDDETQADTNRLKAIHVFISKGYLFSKPDSAFYFAEMQYDFASEMNNKKHQGKALNSQGVSFHLRGDYPKAIDYYTQSIKIKEEIGDKMGKSNSLGNIGVIYKNQGDYAKAIDNYTQGLKIDEEIGHKKGKATKLMNIGIIFDLQGNYAKSIDYYTQSLKINEEIGNKKGKANLLMNIGIIYKNQGDYTKAIDNYTQSLKINEEIGNKKGKSNALGNIGAIYHHQENYSKAMEYYVQSLKINEEIGSKVGIVVMLNYIGGIYRDQGNSSKAMEYYVQSLKIGEEVGIKEDVARALSNIGNIYKDQGDYAKAFKYNEQAITIAQEVGVASETEDAAFSLWEINKKLGKYKESLEMYELYISTRDSLDNEENQKEVIRQEFKYAYEKQADSTAIEQQKKDDLALAEEKRKEDVATKENEKKNLIIGAGAGGLGLVLFFTFFVINRLRITRKQKDIIEIQKVEVEQQKSVVEQAHEQLEEKNTEIMDSIAYAKRIQSAILPPDKLVKEYLSESFILYKPKDVVAGDFYWMEHKDNKVLFAAADCTGHGVPGAMVSVICNNGLNRSVKEYGLTDPAKILDKTREIVISEFEKSEEEVKDGMDIALCSLEGNTLKYAGANNPLWLIRKGEILETKANKQPIGKYTDPKPFTTHSLELEKGDVIYIFSDGYVDQFGGEKGKKFKPANLRELLLSIQDQSMEQQKVILDKSFESWRGELEQIDDVCFIGVKV